MVLSHSFESISSWFRMGGISEEIEPFLSNERKTPYFEDGDESSACRASPLCCFAIRQVFLAITLPLCVRIDVASFDS